MALFEPTNITPDEKGAFGNGVVDITKGLTVSWQVNGNAATPMTSCSVKIMENNAESTFVYMTPFESINPPFYPTDEKGIPIPYTMYIPYDILFTGRTYEVKSSTITVTSVDYDTFLEKVGQKGRYTYSSGNWHIAGGTEPDLGTYGISYTGTPQDGDVIVVVCGTGMQNGLEYKLLITQFADKQTVTQKSASVFLARSTPTLTINGFDLPVSSQKYTFAATYSQAQGDALMWARWQLASVGEQGERTEIYDTGRMYGVAVLKLTVDGLMSGSSYSVRCSGETVNGVLVDSDWVAFPTMRSGRGRRKAIFGYRSQRDAAAPMARRRLQCFLLSKGKRYSSAKAVYAPDHAKHRAGLLRRQSAGTVYLLCLP